MIFRAAGDIFSTTARQRPSGSWIRSEAVIASGGLYRFPENRRFSDHVYATFEYPSGRTAVFSSIESNAFDDDYEAYFGTKGTLIMLREREALLFEEGDVRARDAGPIYEPLQFHRSAQR